MEGSVIDLSKYRFESAKEDLETARSRIKDGKFKASVNRSQYAIFHSLRAVTALAQYDSSKHSGVIAFFNRTYVKEKIFERDDIELKKDELYLKINNQSEITHLNKILLDNKINFVYFGLLKPDLEEIFLNIMKESKEGEKIWLQEQFSEEI